MVDSLLSAKGLLKGERTFYIREQRTDTKKAARPSGERESEQEKVAWKTYVTKISQAPGK